MKGKIKDFDLIKHWKIYLMALPVVILVLVFSYFPLAGIVLAFEHYTVDGGIFGSEWVGLQNFETFFQSSDWLKLTRNIFVINFGNLIVGTITTLAGAIALDQLVNQKMKKLYQNLMFLPYFFSVLIIVKFVGFFFNDDNGMINSLLNNMGFPSVKWGDKPDAWVLILIFSSAWKGLGYGVIVYVATISGFDESVYEAAIIDGAGRWARVWHITLKLLFPTVVTLMLLNIGRIFYGDFMYVYSFVGDNYALKERLDIIETYLFRNLTGTSAETVPDYGLNAAIGLYQSVLGLIMILGSNLLARKYDKNAALF